MTSRKRALIDSGDDSSDVDDLEEVCMVQNEFINILNFNTKSL